MKAYCIVPGCDRAATGHGRYCNAHKSRKRRHGHPLQATITTAMVKPYRQTIGNWIDTKDNAEAVWKQLEDRWLAVVSWAEDTQRLWESGRAMPWPHRDAAQEILKLHQDVKPRMIIETVSAMGYMLQADPRRFRDDHAYRTQLVRRTRGLTDVNSGTWYDHDTGKVKRVYRELRPKVVAVLAKALVDALGVVGLMIHQRIEQQHQQNKEGKMALYEAMGVDA